MAEKIAGSTVATSETASPDILFKMYESITKPFLLARLKDPRYKEDIIFSREKFDGDLQESFSEYSGENGALLDVFLHINRYDGLIEETSKGYATAKLFGIELFESYRKEFGYNWCTIIPSNLYGFGDWESSSDGHVIAMLTKKILSANKFNYPEVELWGDGKSLRNFLNIDDLASAILFITKINVDFQSIININGDTERSIFEIAQMIKKVIKYDGTFVFDKTKPNGARKKALNDNYIRGLGWKPEIDLERGIAEYVSMTETLKHQKI